MPAKKKESDNKPPAYKTCSNGHKNSLNAKACWVCGASMDTPKPTFTQVTNTTVIMAPLVPYIGIDVNIVVPGECEKYVGKRERCDEKDPSGHICIFIPNCVTRLNRFKKNTIMPPKSDATRKIESEVNFD